MGCHAGPIYVQVTKNLRQTIIMSPTSINLYVYIQGVWVASLAHSLLVHAFHLYILHGRLLLVLLYSMSKLNNNGSKARYSNRPSLIINVMI